MKTKQQQQQTNKKIWRFLRAKPNLRSPEHTKLHKCALFLLTHILYWFYLLAIICLLHSPHVAISRGRICTVRSQQERMPRTRMKRTYQMDKRRMNKKKLICLIIAAVLIKFVFADFFFVNSFFVSFSISSFTLSRSMCVLCVIMSDRVVFRYFYSGFFFLLSLHLLLNRWLHQCHKTIFWMCSRSHS